MGVNKNYAAWGLENSVQFYAGERNKVGDLYPSEAAFLPPIVPRVSSVLDIGCATGGFFQIFKELNPKVSYVGVDISKEMVEVAKSHYPAGDFRVSDGNLLDFPDRSFDLVHCTGMLNHCPDFGDYFKEMNRVARRFVILDLPRLHLQARPFDIKECYMILKERFQEHTGQVDHQASTVPYVVVKPAPVFQALVESFDPQVLSAKGYYGKCNPSVKMPYDQVCFCVVSIDKQKTEPKTARLSLPDEIKAALSLKGFKDVQE